MIILKIILDIIIIAACVGLVAMAAELAQKKSNEHKPYGPYERFIKRFLDAFLSTGALIVLSPILLIIAALVRTKLGSPVLFTQDRPGRDEKIFKLYKLNIIKGDMAVIGPRPLLVEYLPYYTTEEHHRHDVRPGLTGWAQVNGRNAIHSWEERFQYDLEYVNHISLSMDLKVLFTTVGKVLKRSDIQVGSEIKVGRLDVARNESKYTKV